MKNIITIGRRCTTDSFLEKYKIRKFSGPFSYLIIDFESALIEINNNFCNYLKKIKKINNKKILYLKHWRMSITDFYINENYLNLKLNNLIYNEKRVLLWNHHNPIKQNILFKRRINRVLNLLKNTKCVLFYIDKICEINIDTYILYINNIIKKYYNYNHKIIFILPITDDIYKNFDCKLYYSNDTIDIFLLKVTPINDLVKETKKQRKKGTPLLDIDINDKNINWNLLYKNINHLFLP